jgi:hypothetical protein
MAVYKPFLLGEREMEKDSRKDSIASDGLVELAQYLRDKGYGVHGINFREIPLEKDGELGLYFTVNVSKYVTLDSD